MKNIKNTKTFYIGSLIFCSLTLSAQVAIGKTSVNGNSTLLDFGGATATNSPTDVETTNFKGIILPALTATPTFSATTPTTNNPQNGTFIFDKTSVKVRMFTNGSWVDMSDTGSLTNLTSNTSAESGNGVIIGSNISSATGVLVLESANKAIILPHIKNPHTTVKSPYAGMMCYDTVSNSIAVYDGSNWNYWK